MTSIGPFLKEKLLKEFQTPFKEVCFHSVIKHYIASALADVEYTRVIEFLRNFEFRNWHAMRGGLMLPDLISEEKIEID